MKHKFTELFFFLLAIIGIIVIVRAHLEKEWRENKERFRFKVRWRINELAEGSHGEIASVILDWLT